MTHCLLYDLFRLIGGYLTLVPEFCFVIEDETSTVCGYIVSAPDKNDFKKKCSVAWTPLLRQKYPVNSAEPPAETVSLILYYHLL